MDMTALVLGWRRRLPPWPGSTSRNVKSKEVQMRIGLFIPCYIDAFFPKVGIATLELLERFGHDVHYPRDQTAAASRWPIVDSTPNAPIPRRCSCATSPASTTSFHRPAAASTTCGKILTR